MLLINHKVPYKQELFRVACQDHRGLDICVQVANSHLKRAKLPCPKYLLGGNSCMSKLPWIELSVCHKVKNKGNVYYSVYPKKKVLVTFWAHVTWRCRHVARMTFARSFLVLQKITKTECTYVGHLITPR